MDRYATLEDYAAAKARIFARCDTAVINLDDRSSSPCRGPGSARSAFHCALPSAPTTRW